MRSGTSFFDLTIYRKTLNRFWPLWAANLVIWLFILPFNAVVELGDGRIDLYRFASRVGEFATEWAVIFAVVGGVLVAMAVCSHLYNHRSANFMGSLPVRRESQFLSTYLAGLTMLVGPNVVVFALTLLVEAVGGAVLMSSLLFWLGALCAMEFFFYTFAVCIGQFTGHILALPVYYGIFNCLVYAVYSLVYWVISQYYFGFARGMDGEEVVMWFTPVAMLLQMDGYVSVEHVATIDTAEYAVVTEGLWIAGIYAIVAVVLLVCAMLLYRRRHLETAGDVVAVKVVRPVFKYGVAFCSGMFLGYLIDQMFSLGEVGLMAWTVIWGIVGYFVAQMLLDKSIRVLKKWKGAAAVTAVFLVLFAVIGFDLTMYENRVPDAGQVKSVVVNGLNGDSLYDTGSYLDDVVLTDSAEIADVIALHKAVLEFGENGERRGDGSYVYVTFNVEYTLKSGRTIVRKYNISMGDQLLALVTNIRSRENVRVQAYLLDEVAQWEAQGGVLDSATVSDQINEYSYGEFSFDAEAACKLWDAVMADFAADRIGVYTADGSANEYEKMSTRLYFYWERNHTAYIKTNSSEAVTKRVEFAVPKQAIETRRVLEELLKTAKEVETEKTLEDLLAGV